MQKAIQTQQQEILSLLVQMNKEQQAHYTHDRKLQEDMYKEEQKRNERMMSEYQEGFRSMVQNLIHPIVESMKEGNQAVLKLVDKIQGPSLATIPVLQPSVQAIEYGIKTPKRKHSRDSSDSLSDSKSDDDKESTDIEDSSEDDTPLIKQKLRSTTLLKRAKRKPTNKHKEKAHKVQKKTKKTKPEKEKHVNSASLKEFVQRLKETCDKSQKDGKADETGDSPLLLSLTKTSPMSLSFESLQKQGIQLPILLRCRLKKDMLYAILADAQVQQHRESGKTNPERRRRFFYKVKLFRFSGDEGGCIPPAVIDGTMSKSEMIHYLAEHGIGSRFRGYETLTASLKQGNPYDKWTWHMKNLHVEMSLGLCRQLNIPFHPIAL